MLRFKRCWACRAWTVLLSAFARSWISAGASKAIRSLFLKAAMVNAGRAVEVGEAGGGGGGGQCKTGSGGSSEGRFQACAAAVRAAPLLLGLRRCCRRQHAHSLPVRAWQAGQRRGMPERTTGRTFVRLKSLEFSGLWPKAGFCAEGGGWGRALLWGPGRRKRASFSTAAGAPRRRRRAGQAAGSPAKALGGAPGLQLRLLRRLCSDRGPTKGAAVSTHARGHGVAGWVRWWLQRGAGTVVRPWQRNVGA